MTVFPGEGFLHAAVEEVGDVGIFLGFRGAELAQPRASHHLTEQVVEGFRREGHRHRQRLVVLGEGDHRQWADQLTLKALEVGVHKCCGELPHAIRAEVEQHQSVVGLNQLRREANRFEEFVAGAVAVGCFHHLQR